MRKQSKASPLSPASLRVGVNTKKVFLCGEICFHRFLFSVKLLNFMEVFPISKELMINEEIRDKEVRLIGDDGAQLGVMKLDEAMSLAAAKELDLVKIAPKAEPPVCKIMDYGKYRFEQSKMEKEKRKNQKVIALKEIQFSPTIDVADFNVKVERAKKFLAAGDKLKVSVRFRGREMQHTAKGEDVLNRFVEAIEGLGTVDKKPKLEGRRMVMIVTSTAGK